MADEMTSPPAKTERRSRLRPLTDSGPSGFYCMVTGQIESAAFPDLDNLFCRYSFSHGPDWRVCQGIDQGFSQVARKSSGGDASVVWNFPIDVTFKSTNAFGWPRLVVSVYSQDFLGRYVIRGYGSVLLPTTPGRYVRIVRTFAPASSSLLQAALSWLTGSLPEFYDARFAAAGKGREVVRTTSTGLMRVSFNVVTKGMASHGYTNGGPPDAPDLDAEAAPLGPAGGGSGALPSLASLVATVRRSTSTCSAGSSAAALSSTSSAAPASSASASAAAAAAAAVSSSSGSSSSSSSGGGAAGGPSAATGTGAFGSSSSLSFSVSTSGGGSSGGGGGSSGGGSGAGVPSSSSGGASLSASSRAGRDGSREERRRSGSRGRLGSSGVQAVDEVAPAGESKAP